MLHVFIANPQQSEAFAHGSGPLEFGRSPHGGDARPVTLQDNFVSRRHLVVEGVAADRVRLRNLSRHVPVEFPDGMLLEPGACLEVPLPVRVTVGKTLLDLESHSDDEAGSVLRALTAPVVLEGVGDPFPISAGDVPDVKTLVRWFETLVTVQRAAAGSEEFYRQTARAVVELVGLDCGMVLLPRDGRWRVAAQHTVNEQVELGFSTTILDKVVEEQRTFFDSVDVQDTSQSLANVSTVVASPVFDADGRTVVGVVYGARLAQAHRWAPPVRELDAQLVQVMAAAVGSGLARVASEAEAARRHVQFEQFVSPVVARELDRDPALLEGRKREITVLFADLRNFSRLSERIGAPQVCRLVGAVMDRFAERIREFEGTTVSYLGDGLLAMWNAPIDQPDHAAQACRAALAMIGDLPELGREWRETLGGSLEAGIGINTGTAMVGNMGSRLKPHYGPLGHHVNLASRVEGATKQLGVPILVTGSTRSRLNGDFATRRLGRVRLVGVADPMELYELSTSSAPDAWLARRDAYEAALAHFEAGRFTETCRVLYPFLEESSHPYDHPALTLVGRAVERLKSADTDETFDPVWDLPTK